MFCKSIIKKPYMFRSLLYDHHQVLSYVLCAFTTFPLCGIVVNALSTKDNP
jgi:hypothetical protein